MKKLIIFDADGVLLNSFNVAIKNYNLLADTFSLPKATKEKDFDFIFSGYLRTSLRKFGLDDNSSKKFFDEHSNLMKDEFLNIEPFYNVLKLIIENRESFDYAIASSAYSDAIVNILKKSNVYSDDLFIDILGRELNISKSDKISKLKKINHQNIYIGDMVSDILYCRDAKIRIGAVGYGYNTIPFLNSFNPDFSIKAEENLQDFFNYFLTLKE